MSLSEGQFAGTVAAHGLFDPERPVWIARAPGRLDLAGGNVDYTGGMVLQGLLQEAVWVAAQPRTDDVIRILNPEAQKFGWQVSFQLRTSDLDDSDRLYHLYRESEQSRWVRYVLGGLHSLRNGYQHRIADGLNLFIASDLPPNRGVSSSAALGVAVLKAVSVAYGIELGGIALATAGQWVENVIVGAACGIMDQAAIVLGRKDHLLPILCQPCLPLAPIRLPADLRIWGIDSMVSRSTIGAAYQTARAAAFLGYKMICFDEGIDLSVDEDSAIPRSTDPRWNGYLSNLTPSEFRARYEVRLPLSLSGRECLERIGSHVDPFTKVDPGTMYPIRAAVRYAVEENLRVQTLRTLLEGSATGVSDHTLEWIGELLCQSHEAYAECGLGSKFCDLLVSEAMRSGLAGAKMTGGGAGGVVALVGRPDDEARVGKVVDQYSKMRGSVPYVFRQSSDGVDAFGVHRMRLR